MNDDQTPTLELCFKISQDIQRSWHQLHSNTVFNVFWKTSQPDFEVYITSDTSAQKGGWGRHLPLAPKKEAVQTSLELMKYQNGPYDSSESFPMGKWWGGVNGACKYDGQNSQSFFFLPSAKFSWNVQLFSVWNLSLKKLNLSWQGLILSVSTQLSSEIASGLNQCLFSFVGKKKTWITNGGKNNYEKSLWLNFPSKHCFIFVQNTVL